MWAVRPEPDTAGPKRTVSQRQVIRKSPSCVTTVTCNKTTPCRRVTDAQAPRVGWLERRRIRMTAAASATAGRASRWARIKASMTPAEWRRAALLASAVVGLHLAGFFLLIAVVAPHHYDLGKNGAFGV